MDVRVRRADAADVDAASAVRAMEPQRVALVGAAVGGVDVFVETSAADNVEFYRWLGFVTVAESTVPGGGPGVWSMARRYPV